MGRFLNKAARYKVNASLLASNFDPDDILHALDRYGAGVTLDEEDLNPKSMARLIEQSVVKFNKMPDPVEVYRGVRLKRLEDLNKDKLGIFWTTEKSVAGDKTGSQGQEFVLNARIKKSDIDWDATITSDIGNWDEYEIISRTGSPIEVVEIYLKDKSLGLSFMGRN